MINFSLKRLKEDSFTKNCTGNRVVGLASLHPSDFNSFLTPRVEGRNDFESIYIPLV